MDLSKTEAAGWTATHKIAFRFCFLFFVFFIIINPKGVIPIAAIYIPFLSKGIIWLAANLLHLAKPVEDVPSGSGDKLINYLAMLFLAVFSLIGTLVWTALDRRRKSYNKLYYWLTVIIRYYAGIMMVGYGIVKIIKLQFPSPSLYRLLEPYGESSPMGLAWTFMGFSTGYNYFTGIAEFLCGILLFFRKTSRLGAVLLLVVSANIMAINFCFDVPVKILSTMLVVMAIFLISQDAQSFINFFLLNKTAVHSNLSPHRFKKRWKNIVLQTLKLLLVIYVIGIHFYGALYAEKHYGNLTPKAALYGIYNVQYFICNRDTIPPLATDTNRWQKLVIANKDNAALQFYNDSLRRYVYNNDSVKHELEFVQQDAAVGNSILYYTLPKPDLLLLKGNWKGSLIEILLKRYDEKNLRLMNTTFHWINEKPNNR